MATSPKMRPSTRRLSRRSVSVGGGGESSSSSQQPQHHAGVEQQQPPRLSLQRRRSSAESSFGGATADYYGAAAAHGNDGNDGGNNGYAGGGIAGAVYTSGKDRPRKRHGFGLGLLGGVDSNGGAGLLVTLALCCTLLIFSCLVVAQWNGANSDRATGNQRQHVLDTSFGVGQGMASDGQHPALLRGKTVPSGASRGGGAAGGGPTDAISQQDSEATAKRIHEDARAGRGGGSAFGGGANNAAMIFETREQLRRYVEEEARHLLKGERGGFILEEQHAAEGEEDLPEQKLLEQKFRLASQVRENARWDGDYFRFSSVGVTPLESSGDENKRRDGGGWAELPLPWREGGAGGKVGSFALGVWVRLDRSPPTAEANNPPPPLELGEIEGGSSPSSRSSARRTILSTLHPDACARRKSRNPDAGYPGVGIKLSVSTSTSSSSRGPVLALEYASARRKGDVYGPCETIEASESRPRKSKLTGDEGEKGDVDADADTDADVAVPFPVGEWTHVGLTFQASSSAKASDGPVLTLYQNGRVVGMATLARGDGDYADGDGAGATGDDSRSVVVLGRSLDGTEALEGRMAALAIWATLPTATGTRTADEAADRAAAATRSTATNTLSANQMRHVYRTGADEYMLQHMEDKGLVRLPTVLYPLDGQDSGTGIGIGNDENDNEWVRYETSATMREAMQDRHGKFHRHVDMVPFVPRGGYRYAEYASGANSFDPSSRGAAAIEDGDNLARIRRAHVRNAMRHAWNGYRTYAWGYDELRPQSKRGENNWGGMGTTLVDSLDTLWLMGMREEFWEGRDWVRDHLTHDDVKGAVSVFETTIRSLGGLLSAYDLSGDRAFLDKADDLGGRLARAFDSPSGIPYGQTELSDNGASYNIGWLGKKTVLAEIGTLQVEFSYLAKVTGKRHYADKANRVFDLLRRIQPKSGLYPIYVLNGGPRPQFADKQEISFGAMGDSFYEYMLKLWLQGGKKRTMYRDMYDLAMNGVAAMLVRKSDPSGLTYIAEVTNGKLEHKVDHLACFMGGLLALGAYTDPEGVERPRAQRYARMETGISPEFVRFSKGGDFAKGRNAPYYILRPETAESLFILHRLTGDPVYREWGWEIFQAIETFCKTESAYGGLADVGNTRGDPEDRMESFFLAETLKYLYLLQDPDVEVDILNEHVFNTEAHPLRLLSKVNQQLG